MPVQPLDEQATARLRAAPLSYTRHTGSEGDAPAGYKRLNRSVTLRRRDFDGAARDLFEWRMHSEARLRVQASDIPLCQDTLVLMRWGLGPLSVKIPCRVIDIIDESQRRGFAYGTLPGHPEAGEERFVLEQLEDSRIRFTITAYSRPASRLAKLGGPISLAAQSFMTQRYLRALDRL
ncbi:DUF1990 domain-containing protein [Phycicoccus sp.]|uniref:DUF1990 family protein n=1 Tax=Phycicoccus sp. TaxID=1902410 RepID=UPI002B741499|nr:DUF1990 domain-containing protein [Phycicoccus sp.]HMM94031.1 DUF1990 domain-containing protein [Phycicoccus sp.]